MNPFEPKPIQTDAVMNLLDDLTGQSDSLPSVTNSNEVAIGRIAADPTTERTDSAAESSL